MQIFVNHAGVDVALIVDELDTVAVLRQMAHATYNINHELLLIFAGTRLKNAKTLSRYNIHADSVINVVKTKYRIPHRVRMDNDDRNVAGDVSDDSNEDYDMHDEHAHAWSCNHDLAEEKSRRERKNLKN